ncbi:TfuA-related McrA-glycine thioamidation protein [Methanolapillus africanus]
MTKTVVFLGPTLDLESAKSLFSENVLPTIEFLPPASRGDIEKAAKGGAQFICLIDGVFFEQCSVGHREILHVLRDGIFVMGASSMGALRASEMETFGMVGIGTVFSLYKNKTIESDDEVAVVCDPFSNAALSEALVNIRATLDKAAIENILSNAERNALFDLASSIYYPDRTYDYLIQKAKDEAVLAPDVLIRFEKWVAGGNAVDAKKEDAVLALSFLNQKLNE